MRDWAATHLRGGEPRATDATLPRTAHPAPRRAAWLLTQPADCLTPPEVSYVDALCAAVPPLGVVRARVAEFRALFVTHDASGFGPWLGAAEESELRLLARSFWRDRAAIEAAIRLPWSNGQVEGQVNRLKLVKRTMYGRASFPLLRRRVLAA